MGAADAIALVGQFGAMGLLVAYLIWKAERDDRRRREQAAERAEIDKADIAAREKLASSLTALSMVIQGRPHV